MDGVRFRTMALEEVATAVEWAAKEVWNPGLSDADRFYAVDPEGFFCAEADGKIVGTVSVVNYDDRFSFAGLFLHYNNARYQGTGGGTVPAGLTPLKDVPFAALAEYDAAHFPARREKFLRCWIGQEGHYGLARLDGNGRIFGYGVRRACHTGHKIGPLFASDRATAEMILDGLVAGIPIEPFFLDIPVPNSDAVALVKDRGMVPVFFTARLYTTPDPVPLPLGEIFGVTTFELG